MIHPVQLQELAAQGAHDMSASERLLLIAELAAMDCTRVGGSRIEAERLRGSALLALACAHHISLSREQADDAIPSPPFAALVDVLAAYFNVSQAAAAGWLSQIPAANQAEAV